MFNLAVDDKHVTLAFGLQWIKRLASHFEHIDVVTMTAGNHNLPNNVTVWSVGRERGYSKSTRLLRFYWLLGKVFRRRQIDVVFTHMIPAFAVLAWPVLKPLNLRNVLWYAHGSTPMMLKIAHYFVNTVVSSTPQGFRLKSKKVIYVGQGIDETQYKPIGRQARAELRIVTVGRLAPSKGIDIIISALKAWRSNVAWHFTIGGDATSDSELNYAKTLYQLARNSLPKTNITFTGRLDSVAISSLLNESDVFVNMSSTGSLDKAIVEAMASACPVISSNEAFGAIAAGKVFSQYAIPGTADALVKALERFASLDQHRRNEIGDSQAEIAHKNHTLSALINRLFNILTSNARSAPRS